MRFLISTFEIQTVVVLTNTENYMEIPCEIELHIILLCCFVKVTQIPSVRVLQKYSSCKNLWRARNIYNCLFVAKMKTFLKKLWIWLGRKSIFLEN